MRKLLMGLGVVALLVTNVYANPITLNINDQEVWTPVAPVLEADSTLVPLRIIGENLGATVGWDDFTKVVTINKGGKEIKLLIGSKTIEINNVKKQLLAPPKLLKGTTMVPLRVISENLESDVHWDSRSRTVYVRDHVARYVTNIQFVAQDKEEFYQGEVIMQNGREIPDGEGELLLKSGEIYAGFFRNGEITLGKVIYTNDEIYEGQFKYGKPHGEGIYFYDNGNYYEGAFENGLFNGYGKITYDTGEISEGYFENGQYMWE